MYIKWLTAGVGGGEWSGSFISGVRSAELVGCSGYLDPILIFILIFASFLRLDTSLSIYFVTSLTTFQYIPFLSLLDLGWVATRKELKQWREHSRCLKNLHITYKNVELQLNNRKWSQTFNLRLCLDLRLILFYNFSCTLGNSLFFFCLFICVYIYMCMYICVYIYLYTHT